MLQIEFQKIWKILRNEATSRMWNNVEHVESSGVGGVEAFCASTCKCVTLLCCKLKNGSRPKEPEGGKRDPPTPPHTHPHPSHLPCQKHHKCWHLKQEVGCDLKAEEPPAASVQSCHPQTPPWLLCSSPPRCCWETWPPASQGKVNRARFPSPRQIEVLVFVVENAVSMVIASGVNGLKG